MENSCLYPWFHSQCLKKEPEVRTHFSSGTEAAETHLLKWSQFHIDDGSLDKELVAKKGEEGLLHAHGGLENVRSLLEELRKTIF